MSETTSDDPTESGCCHTPGGHGIDRANCHRCWVETRHQQPQDEPPPSETLRVLELLDHLATDVAELLDVAAIDEDVTMSFSTGRDAKAESLVAHALVARLVYAGWTFEHDGSDR